jgi:hypothetical protein
MIASGSQSLLYQADVTAGYALLQFHNPNWLVGGDMDGDQAVATRRKLLDQLATDRIMMSGYHIPFPSLGYVEKDGANYRLVPVLWSPVI